MTAIDAAWSRQDWPAAVKASETALASFPGDAEVQEKLFAARVNHADLLAAQGQKAEAARIYSVAAAGQPNALIDDRLRGE